MSITDSNTIQTKIAHSTCIVVKIGTNVLMESTKKSVRTPNTTLILDIVTQIVQLRKTGKKIILVSSGAIGFGAAELHITSPVVDIPTRQTCAAVGQPLLMQIYKQAFQKFNMHCAQLLLTGNDFKSKSSYEALHNCIKMILSKGLIPIINENDSVSVDEIGVSFGDNDNLSAMVASSINADLLVLLTDVDALYDKNPKRFIDATRIELVSDIEAQIIQYNKFQSENSLLANNKPNERKSMNGEPGSDVGTGGIITKLQAARVAQLSDCITMMTLATRPQVLIDILKGKNLGTVFY